MTRTQQITWAIAIVVVLGGLYWWWSSSQSAMSMTPSSSQTSTTNIPATSNQTSGTSNSGGTGTGVTVSTGVSTGSSAPMSATVMFNGSSFSPASVTIAQGGTVTWTSSAGSLWVASNPHPIHNGYDGTSMQQHCAPGYTGATPFDECAGGTTYSFTFSKVGTWGYHDHLDSSIMGSVTVIAQ